MAGLPCVLSCALQGAVSRSQTQLDCRALSCTRTRCSTSERRRCAVIAIAAVSGRSDFARAAGIVGALGLLSKVAGIAREGVIAGHFGTGPTVDAFNFATCVPVLFVTTIGGLNGALHSAITAVTADKSTEDAREIVRITATRVGAAMALLAAFVAAFPQAVIFGVAPGLCAATSAQASCMLRILSPVILLSGWMGVSVGGLVTSGAVAVPAATPLVGNLVFLGFAALTSHMPGLTFGARELAGAVTVATACQWLLQTAALQRVGLAGAAKWGKSAEDERNFRQVLAVSLPAAMSSVALCAAAFTDFFFASFMPGAAAAMGFAMLIGMAPFGVISSSLLVPVLPQLASASGDASLEITAGVLTSLACVLAPLVGLMTVLAQPLVALMLSGRAFQQPEIAAVSALLPMVAAGAAAGVVRDLLARVFYSRGNARFPLAVSSGALVVNAALDLTGFACGWGVHGLVISTAATTAAACAVLWRGLQRDDVCVSPAVERDAAAVVGLAAVSSACAYGALQLAQTCCGAELSRPFAAVACSGCTFVGVTVFALLLLGTRQTGLRNQRAAILQIMKFAWT